MSTKWPSIHETFGGISCEVRVTGSESDPEFIRHFLASQLGSAVRFATDSAEPDFVLEVSATLSTASLKLLERGYLVASEVVVRGEAADWPWAEALENLVDVLRQAAHLYAIHARATPQNLAPLDLSRSRHNG